MTDLLRQEIATGADPLVIKIGSRPLTRDDGTLNEERISRLAEEINALINLGKRVVLVSSGAVAAGMGQLGQTQRPEDLPRLQAAAAIGQSYLIQAYERSLRSHGHHAAQILLTAEDLENRSCYLNVRNTLTALLEMGAVPIVNENDTLSVAELNSTFGDNDRLAALVTNLLQAPLLVILSDVEGLYDRDPRDPQAQLIPTVSQLDESILALTRDRATGLSKGGMTSKLRAAEIATRAGENVIIASGIRPGVLGEIFTGATVGTLFLARGATIKARKRWIGFSVQPRGRLVLDPGARRAVENQGRSLLAIGIVEVQGPFTRGDVVSLVDHEGVEFARGLTNYTSAEVQRIKGLHTEQIAQEMGSCPYSEVVHRDHLTVWGPDASPLKSATLSTEEPPAASLESEEPPAADLPTENLESENPPSAADECD
jgi:glutamate 5-kinase